MNILDAMKDNNVFGKHFRGSTWDAWRVFLCALLALPIDARAACHLSKTHRPQRAVNSTAARGVARLWSAQWQELHARVHRRLPGPALPCWRPFLGPGEVATIMIIAADRRQARVIMRYCLGLLRAVPMLKQLIEGQTAESITLRNRVVIEVHTASFRSTRAATA